MRKKLYYFSSKSIKLFIRKHYFLYKICYQFIFQLSHMIRKDYPILVFSMGKSGTETIFESIKNSSYKGPVYHVHRLSEKGILEEIEKSKLSNNPYYKSQKRIIASQFLNSIIFKNDKNIQWKVVSLVREPISRNISAFFQEINIWAPRLLDKYLINNEDVVDDLIDQFFKRYRHDTPLKWFDNELKSVFGIDVYSETFNKDQGFSIYGNDSTEVLVLRLENLNKCAKIAFSEFLGLNNFNLIQSNISNNKYYKELYFNFKHRINIPSTYIEKMYKSKFCKHFYSEIEINKFVKYWSDS